MTQFGIRNSEFGIARFIPHSPFPIPHSIRGWFVLLGVLLVVGLVKVAMAVTVWRSAYAAGQQVAQIHALENDTQWLQTQVVALQAPAHLAKTMSSERTSFVARMELPAILPRDMRSMSGTESWKSRSRDFSGTARLAQADE